MRDSKQTNEQEKKKGGGQNVLDVRKGFFCSFGFTLTSKKSMNVAASRQTSALYEIEIKTQKKNKK